MQQTDGQLSGDIMLPLHFHERHIVWFYACLVDVGQLL